MDLKNSVRKYDTADSKGQRVIFWKKYDSEILGDLVYIVNKADIYEKDSDAHVGVTTFVFGVEYSENEQIPAYSELLKELCRKIGTFGIRPETVDINPLFTEGFESDRIFSRLYNKYHNVTDDNEPVETKSNCARNILTIAGIIFVLVLLNSILSSNSSNETSSSYCDYECQRGRDMDDPKRWGR